MDPLAGMFTEVVRNGYIEIRTLFYPLPPSAPNSYTLHSDILRYRMGGVQLGSAVSAVHS